MSLLIISLTITFATYFNMLNGYFQQDEWLAFAFNHVLQGDWLSILAQCFASSVGHYQPFNTLLLFILTNIFKINYTPYAILSILLHLLNVILVFYLAKTIFRDNKLSFISSLLFGTNSTIHQATTWVMADTGIHLSVFFALLSILSFIKFIDSKNIKTFIASIALLFVSLLFKETAIAFFVFYPIIFYLFADKKLKMIHKFPIIILVSGLTYFMFRIYMVLLPSSYSNNNVLVTQSLSYFHLIYNFLTIPIKSFVQSIIPSTYLMSFSRNISTFLPSNVTGEIGTTAFDNFVLKRFFETLVIFIFALSSYFLFKISSNFKNIFDKKLVISFVIFTFLNSFIYALSPEQSGIMSEVASRNLYFVSIGTIFLTVFLFKKIYFVLFIIIVSNIFLVNRNIKLLNQNSALRQDILTQIYQDNLVIDDKQIFYIESDKSYYGLPENVKILPFQSGFGQTLMIVFTDSTRLPNDFYKNQFLWEIQSQGYKEIDGHGFGYFRDLDLLKQSLKEYNLPINSVISYSWNSKLNILTNTTEMIRLKLKK